MDWNELTLPERIKLSKTVELSTCLQWEDMSPTTQLLLRLFAGVTNKPMWEA
jgi:hypothetical protein